MSFPGNIKRHLCEKADLFVKSASNSIPGQAGHMQADLIRRMIGKMLKNPSAGQSERHFLFPVVTGQRTAPPDRILLLFPWHPRIAERFHLIRQIGPEVAIPIRGRNQHQITAQNVSDLTPVWVFPTGVFTEHHQSPPIVNGGTMFVTTSTHVIALDAKSGEPLWRYVRELPPDTRTPHLYDHDVHD